MKLENKYPNYCATIVKIDKTHKLENSDNLVGVNIFGYSVITGKDINLLELYIFFTAETQLSESFLYQNNLYSSQELNKDVTKKGYFSKNGRVRAVKLRGNPSNGLIMPISSLSFLLDDSSRLREGDMFTHINGVEICKKYFVPTNNVEGKNKQRGIEKKYERIDGKHFPEHIDTDNYFRNEDKYKNDDFITVTQKLHGTSCRIGNVECLVKQTLLDRILFRQRKEYDYIAGSRRVIKDLKSGTQYQHFYKTENLDIYNRVLEKYKNCIPKDTIIYGEVVGYIDWTQIQNNYTYDCLFGEWEFYVYRIVTINRDGQTVDYSWEAIKEFCKNTGMLHVPEIISGYKSDININSYIDCVLSKEKFIRNAIPLSTEGTFDEGVCIRTEGIKPYITKAKSPLFFEYETKQLDEGVVSLEDNQN